MSQWIRSGWRLPSRWSRAASARRMAAHMDTRNCRGRRRGWGTCRAAAGVARSRPGGTAHRGSAPAHSVDAGAGYAPPHMAAVAWAPIPADLAGDAACVLALNLSPSRSTPPSCVRQPCTAASRRSLALHGRTVAILRWSHFIVRARAGKGAAEALTAHMSSAGCRVISYSDILTGRESASHCEIYEWSVRCVAEDGLIALLPVTKGLYEHSGIISG